MSANIATALAERGWDVLAIDGDFIHRDLTAVLLESDRVADPGLSEVLMGQVSLEQAAQLVPVAHGARLGSLCVLAPGASGHLLPGLAASYDPGEFQAKICQPYDAVIIDGPPLAGVAYAADLASLVGNIIIVVNHDDLVGPQLDFIDQLQATSGHIIGYIYNRAPLRKDFASYYRDQYDSYGRPAQAAAPNETTDTATDTRSTTGSTATLLAERPGPGPSPETATSKAPGADPNGAPGTPGHPTEGRR
jgi:Mrp family chromosome partitioning ATPase